MFVSSIHARYVHMENAQVTVEKYTDGSLALMAEDTDEDGMPNHETFSVNLSAYGMYPPEGHIFVKDYSEHEGLAQALVNAGLVSIVQPIVIGEFGSPGYLVRITDATLVTAMRLGVDASKDAAENAKAEADRMKEAE